MRKGITANVSGSSNNSAFAAFSTIARRCASSGWGNSAAVNNALASTFSSNAASVGCKSTVDTPTANVPAAWMSVVPAYRLNKRERRPPAGFRLPPAHADSVANARPHTARPEPQTHGDYAPRSSPPAPASPPPRPTSAPAGVHRSRFARKRRRTGHHPHRETDNAASPPPTPLDPNRDSAPPPAPRPAVAGTMGRVFPPKRAAWPERSAARTGNPAATQTVSTSTVSPSASAVPFIRVNIGAFN